MGGSVWSSEQLFDKSVHLEYPNSRSTYDRDSSYSSKFTYYEALRQAAERMERSRSQQSPLSLHLPIEDASGAARDEADGGAADAAKDASFLLTHWPREVDVVFDRNDESLLTIPIEHELDFDSAEIVSVAAFAADKTTFQESILNGLNENKLSSSEAIHNATEQLRAKLHDDPTRFLCVLSKYLRATRLFASQQLHARLDVERAFHLHVLSREYAFAAHVAGKLAYGEHTSRVQTKLRRLDVMARLLRLAVETTKSHERARATHSSSRSTDLFDLVMTDEAIALLRRQNELQTALGVDCFVGGSLIETLHKLLALYSTNAPALVIAIGVAEEFEVHPRQFAWAVLRAFAQTEQWHALLALTAATRPAIGYRPVVELLLDNDHAELAHDLLALIDASHEREELEAVVATYHASGHAGCTAVEEEQAEVVK